MGSPSRLSPEELSSKYDLDLELVREAFEHFDSLEALLLAFSGKIGSGKDSVAPRVFAILNSHSPRPLETDSFGTNLKEELNSLISVIRASGGQRRAAREIATDYGSTIEEASHLVSLLYPEIQSGLIQSAYDRTQGNRDGLQFWATEVRRNQDPLYWVKPVLQRTIDRGARGISTQITDVRFFTEAWGVIDAGGWTIRLDVSEAEQRRRVLERDGIEIKESTKAHSSETELDGFADFAVRIQTDDYSSVERVASVVAGEISSVASTLF